MNTPSSTDDPATLFELEAAATNEAIRKVIEDIPDVCVRLDQREYETDVTSVRDSQECAELAATIVHTMTSVASAAPLPPKRTSSFAMRPTARDWENVSVSGIPLSHESSKRIQAWSAGIQTLAPSDATSDILSALTKMSTIGDDHVDMDAQLIKQRFELAQRLYSDRKFTEAVPHLERTLNTFTAQTEARQDIQMLLAKALMEIRPVSKHAETLLTEIVDNSSDRRHAEALGLLATVRMELYPDNLDKAKQSCRLAIVARRSIFGQYHEQTMDAVYQMAHLCTLSNDSDAIVWRQMLPEHLRSHSATGSRSPHMQLPSSPFAPPSSHADAHSKSYLDDITRLKADIKQYESRLEEKDHKLHNISMQAKALEESNSLRGEVLTMTRAAAQELQVKHSNLVEEHRTLQAERQDLERSREVLEQELQVQKYRAAEDQIELQTDAHNAQVELEAAQEDWARQKIAREAEMNERVYQLELKHKADLEKKTGCLDRRQGDSPCQIRVAELHAMHRREMEECKARDLQGWHQVKKELEQLNSLITAWKGDAERAITMKQHGIKWLMRDEELGEQLRMSTCAQQQVQMVQGAMARVLQRDEFDAQVESQPSTATAPSPNREQALTPGQRLRQEHEQSLAGRGGQGMSDAYREKEAKLREMLQSRLPDQKPIKKPPKSGLTGLVYGQQQPNDLAASASTPALVAAATMRNLSAKSRVERAEIFKT